MSLNKDIYKLNETATKLFGNNKVDKNKWIDQKTKELVSDTMSALVDLTNGQGNDQIVDGMVDGIHRSHRYLQGEFINTFLTEFLTKYGEMNDCMYQDGRNELAKKLALKMGDPYNIKPK